MQEEMGESNYIQVNETLKSFEYKTHFSGNIFHKYGFIIAF